MAVGAGWVAGTSAMPRLSGQRFHIAHPEKPKARLQVMMRARFASGRIVSMLPYAPAPLHAPHAEAPVHGQR